MSATATPQIPIRPNRSPNHAGTGASGLLPQVPPRPPSKGMDRSGSPNTYQSSPLNHPPSNNNLGRSTSNNPSNLSLPPRPPSVSLPSIGQEGNEYADIDYENANPASQSTDREASTQTSNIGGESKLHAPKPSLPQSSAKAQVKTVTRTNDQQAAAHGFGLAAALSSEEQGSTERPTTSRAPSNLESWSQSSPPSSRRYSMPPVDDEPVPAEVGLRVPINPEAGEVQAPSPAPLPTIADHQSPGKKRSHARSSSSREASLPPGSYGLHGHGVQSHDKFDKDWYAKHPNQLAHEETTGHGHYASTGSGRGEWAMSSDDLNKIVRDTASRGAGLGTHEGLMSYPDEQIGYIASEQYSSRSKNPSQSGGYLHKLHSNTSQPVIESPLHKVTSPEGIRSKGDSAEYKQSLGGNSQAIDSDIDEDVIHVVEPSRRFNKVTGGEETINESADLGPQAGNSLKLGGYRDENSYGVPILASDEVAKDVGGEFLQPAISPKPDLKGSNYHVSGDDGGGDHLMPLSRSSSRTSGASGALAPLARLSSRLEDREDMHTPLDNVDEYEPLFPEDDEPKQKPLDPAERFQKRSDTVQHRFPSQDIWEDTPSSAMHVTTVANLDGVAQESLDAKPTSRTFEDPSIESARKGEVDEAERAKLVPKAERLAKSKFAPHLRDDMPTQPHMQQRFPSRDIWEDTPDSSHLVTTVAQPTQPSDEPERSLEEKMAAKPAMPPRPVNGRRLGETSAGSNVPISGAVKELGLADRRLPESEVLERNVSPTEAKQGPPIPGRPKPQVPARPAKKGSLEVLTKTASGASSGQRDAVTSPSLPKAKPLIPAKVGGNKPNLPASFMSDLNQRLQLGPRPAAKEPEAEPQATPVAQREIVPLLDARKARSRGPPRRAPAKSSSSSSDGKGTTLAPKFSVYSVTSLWSIDGRGGLVVGGRAASLAQGQDPVPTVQTQDVDGRLVEASESIVPVGLANNMAGDSVDPSPIYSEIPTPSTDKDDESSRKNTSPPVGENQGRPSSPSPQATSSPDNGETHTTVSDDKVSDGIIAADIGAEAISQEQLPKDGIVQVERAEGATGRESAPTPGLDRETEQEVGK